MANIIKPEDAWLGLDIDVASLNNPLLNRAEKDIRRPDLHLLKLMREPKYLGYAAKVLLNVELLESFGLDLSLCLLLVVGLVSHGLCLCTLC